MNLFLQASRKQWHSSSIRLLGNCRQIHVLISNTSITCQEVEKNSHCCSSLHHHNDHHEDRPRSRFFSTHVAVARHHSEQQQNHNQGVETERPRGQYYSIKRDEMESFLLERGLMNTSDESVAGYLPDGLLGDFENSGEIVFVSKHPIQSGYTAKNRMVRLIKSGKELQPTPRPTNDFFLVVWSGVNKFNGKSRERGTDAIRIQAVCVHPHGTFRSKAVRVYRIQNWEANLDKRLQEITLRIHTESPTCRSCGTPMVIKEGKFGSFFGCIQFTNPKVKCRCTMDL